MKQRALFRLITPISGFIGRQLANPRGWFGRVVMTRVLNSGNRELIVSSLDAVTLSHETRLLDVGFGGGLALELAHERGVSRLFGADPSPAAVEELSRTKKHWLSQRTLTLKQASVEQLPFEASSMDVIVSTNTIYFWKDLAAAFRELRRVISATGTLVLGFASNEKLRGFDAITQRGFLFHETEEVLARAREAGFSSVRLLALHGRNTEGDFLLIASP